MTFATTLATDHTTIANASWADIEREIAALDAITQTLVVVAPAQLDGATQGECHLAVGGGADGRFIVYMTEDNLTFWNLIDPDKLGDLREVQMRIGGQDGYYREAQFVSRELALRAARRYAADGQRAGELHWCPG